MGDAPGRRHVVDLGDMVLETGAALGVTLAYETWGTLSEACDNAILIEHALTGDSHVVGERGPGHSTPGWWEGLVGPGLAIDTDRYFVVCANVLGGCQGSTGPSSLDADGRAWGSRFPSVSIRDQVQAETLLADALGIARWELVIGGSMGGMRTLEWAVGWPDRVARAAVIATCAAATADQIAWAYPQLLAVRADPDFAGGDYYDKPQWPDAGLGLARRIAHTTYRAASDLEARFGRAPRLESTGTAQGFAVESYLDHHADKLVMRFDPNSYLVLTEAMNGHDVGRGRGGVDAALRRVTAATTVVAVSSDRLYLPEQSFALADRIAGAHLEIISSPAGHDGFLIDTARVGEVTSRLLARTT
jgi:homoserine O-acetyltransferase